MHAPSQANGDGCDVVPNSDLTVAREAYRDNTSKYFLNGKTSNFTEVTKVLKGKGVDLDNNRFLILQVRQPAPDVEDPLRHHPTSRLLRASSPPPLPGQRYAARRSAALADCRRP